MLEKIKDKPLVKVKKPKDEIDAAIQAFLNKTTGRWGKYYAVKNALVYRVIVTSNYGEEVNIEQNIIAMRIDRHNETLFIGNSSVLPLIGRKVAYGHENNNRNETEIQKRLSTIIPMVPFSVFTEANLDLSKINILERGNEENIVRRINNPKYDYRKPEKQPEFIDEEVHYTGASLFEVEGRTFLFDIDRNEIKHKIFNAFLVEINKSVHTIKDAYQTLKPKMVLDAEKNKLDVKRQGEWFFIPVNEIPKVSKIFGENKNESYTLRAGNNRPNYASMGFEYKGIHYVKGKITHSGREHHMLTLPSWHIVVPNTATRSFTITGNID